jgi:hypothetical protein
MSHNKFTDGGDAPPSTSALPVQGLSIPPQAARQSPLRSSLLKKPLDTGSFGGVNVDFPLGQFTSDYRD